jgi:hypothetical protein
VAWDDLPKAQAAQEAPAAPRAPRARLESPAAHAAHGAEPEAVTENVAPQAPEPAEVHASAPPPAPGPNEGALLLQARQHLASDPASTLSLTEEAARRFPSGALAPEREVLAIESLARLGRQPEARARLAAFRAKYPSSPHLARLDSLLGNR